jgi:stage IV sporulation protein FB
MTGRRIPLVPFPRPLHNLIGHPPNGPRAAVVFLSEPAETPADLRFWLFGTHVRVHPFFWLMAAVLGWGRAMGGDTRTGLIYLGIWMVCVFVSILLHEFGHIWMGRLFGSHGHIVLHSLGGLAIGSNSLNRGWQRFLVSFAGPLIQFVFCGVVFLAAIFFLPAVPLTWHQQAARTAAFLLEINLFWPILNLLPIWPLDGGQMAREVFTALSPRNGLAVTLGVSTFVAGVLAVHCLMVEVNPSSWPLTPYLPFGGWYMGIFFAIFAAQNLMAFQSLMPQRRRYSDDEFPWER